MWCVMYILIHFSTYQEQVRLEVWFSLPCPTLWGLPSEKLLQQVLKSCVQAEVTEGRITEVSSSIPAPADDISMGTAGDAAMPELESSYSAKSLHCF